MVKGKTTSYISCLLPDRRTVAVLFTLADTLGQGSEHQLPGCGGRGCGHVCDVVPAVAVAPLPLARHVDTKAVNCETLNRHLVCL